MEIFIHRNALTATTEELEATMLICGPSNRNVWLKPKLTKILKQYTHLEKDIFMSRIISAVDNTDKMFLFARDWNITIDTNFELALMEMQDPCKKLDEMYQMNTLSTASDFTNKWCIYSRHAVITDQKQCPATRLTNDNYLDIIKNPKDWLYLQMDIND